jgi:hypothetical protein
MTTSNEPPEFYNNLPNLTSAELAALNLLATKRAEEALSGGSYTLQDLTNVSDTVPGSGQNNYPLTWNNTLAQWVASNNIAGVTVRAGAGGNSQAIGSVANSSGGNWIAQGAGAGSDNTTGLNWIALGFDAGGANTSGSNWIAQGVNAGLSNTTGGNWFAQGVNAGFSSTTGGNWFAQGFNAGVFCVTGTNWIAQGASTGFSNTAGSGWIAKGFEAGYFDSRSNFLNIANTRSKSLICGSFANDCIYFGHVGPITSTANVPVPTAAVHAAASSTTRASLRIDSGVSPTTPNTGDIWVNNSNNSLNFQLPLINLQGTQVLTTRRTGWGAPTGTATRTSFNTATATTAQLAERLKALIDDLTTHGLIGP